MTGDRERLVMLMGVRDHGARVLAIALSAALPIGIIALASDFQHHPSTDTAGAVFATLVIACAAVAVEVIHRRTDLVEVRALFPLFLVKLLVTILFLAAFWMPVFQDEPRAAAGEDASRFHYLAVDLAAHDFDPSAIQGFNYAGAPLYYAVLYRLAGANQLFPAMLNALGSLFIGLILVLVAVDLGFGPRAWLLGLYMLVPDVVYNDVLTGKESPAALFFVMAYAGVYGWCAHGSVRGLVVALTGWSVLAWIRPPGALIFLGVVFVVLALNLPPARRRWTVVVGLLLVSGGTVGLSLIENVTESRSLNTMSLAWTMLTAEGELDKFHALEWADRSLGRQLLPETAWQAVASTPVRAALYWISPLAAFDLEWTIVLRSLTATLVLVSLPAILAGLVDAAIRQTSAFRWLGLPFFLITLMTAGGTWVIYDRYRLAAVPFLLPLVTLGYRSRRVSSLAWVIPLSPIAILIAYEVLKH